MKYNISEETWQVMYKLLQNMKGVKLKGEEDTRIFIEAAYYYINSGCKTRQIPEVYGNWSAIYKRYMRWAKKGIWEKIFKRLQDTDKEYYMIDATINRAHRCSAGYKKGSQEEQGLGRSCGGFSTKIHVMVDALGNPVDIIVTAGNKADITQAKELTKELRDTSVIADKGYDSNDFVEFLHNNNCMAVIPTKSNSKNPRSIDKHIYKERHLVECFIGKLKEFRRVFSRYDKSIVAYTAAIHFASIMILMR